MSRVISLITYYNPVSKQISNSKGIIAQSDFTIICDNSKNDNKELIESELEKIVYVSNGENLGISAAYNKVLTDENFKWKDDDYIIFFDQDSAIEKDHIKNLVCEYERLTKEGYSVGCIGPVFFDTSYNIVRTPRMYTKIDSSAMIVDSIITSSMLCKYKDLKEVNFWNNEVFLDMADWDLCWRIKGRKKLCVMTNKSVLTHSVGMGSKKIGLMTLQISKPFREYYETRDCLYLLKKRYVPVKDKIRFIMQVTVRPVLHMLFLSDAKERFYYIKLGMKHYRKGIIGEMPEKDIWKQKQSNKKV